MMPRRILIFLHGTLIMHAAGLGAPREERDRQVLSRHPSVEDYANYVPVGGAADKTAAWVGQGAELHYLSSHETAEAVDLDLLVLRRFEFPPAPLHYRKPGETYGQIAAALLPAVIIEDDCESIGGAAQMVISALTAGQRRSAGSLVVEEFGGIDHLPSDLEALFRQAGVTP